VRDRKSKAKAPKIAARRCQLRTGPGTVLPSAIFAFIKTKPEVEAADIEFIFRAVSAAAHISLRPTRPPFKDSIAIRPPLLHPKSLGEIEFKSTDPFERPRIFNNLPQHPDGLETLMRGIKIGLHPGSTSPLAPFRDEPEGPFRSPLTMISNVGFARRPSRFNHRAEPAASAGWSTINDLRVLPEANFERVTAVTYSGTVNASSESRVAVYVSAPCSPRPLIPPFFAHSVSHMVCPARPAPMVYQPEVVADGIYLAAMHGAPETVMGGTAFLRVGST
jgi:hypothetical protein